MKVFAFLALIAVELFGGWAAQAYVLPRIGLHALTFGQVCIAVLIIGVCQLVAAVLGAITEG